MHILLRSIPYATAAFIVLRASCALFAHGLLRPGVPARLHRPTGRLRAVTAVQS